MIKNLFVTTMVGGLLLGGTAWAQDDQTGDMAQEPAPPQEPAGAQAGGAFTAGTEPAAADGGGARGIGVGVESTLNGIVGASVMYDAGMFEVGGVLFYARESDDEDDTTQSLTALAGRFFYHVHQTDSSSLGLGGGVGLLRSDVEFGGVEDNETDIVLEVGAKLRAFIVPNVALHTSAGISYVDHDRRSTFALGGTAGVNMSFGLTYFLQ